MLNFRIGRIPIQVHWSHLLVAVFLGMGWPPAGGWMGAELADSGHPGHNSARMIWLAMFVGIAFVSILIHELGHAVASLGFGYKPEVQLAWLGGQTAPNANESIPWTKNLVLTACGPAFGMALGLLSLLLALQLPKGTAVFAVVMTLAYINILWSIFNLVPIYPMDGGQMAETVLRRIFGRPGFLAAQVLSLVALAALGLVFWKIGLLNSSWNLFILALAAIRVVTAIQGYLRGDLPAEPHHPSEVAYRAVVAEFKANKLEVARSHATDALSMEMTPPLRGRFHHLLGWIAVKNGEGRVALDHFAQANGVEVEPQALAASFSLVGDEPRALPLWEQAYRDSNDPTVMHEWAGSLIRAGRDDEARRIDGVELATAYRCAERLLFMRGDFAAAASAGVKGLELRPSANAAYDVACAYARAGDKEQAVSVLRRAVELGFKDVEYASTDSDFERLHGYRPFVDLLASLRKSPGS